MKKITYAAIVLIVSFQFQMKALFEDIKYTAGFITAVGCTIISGAHYFDAEKQAHKILSVHGGPLYKKIKTEVAKSNTFSSNFYMDEFDKYPMPIGVDKIVSHRERSFFANVTHYFNWKAFYKQHINDINVRSMLCRLESKEKYCFLGSFISLCTACYLFVPAVDEFCR